jgi:hypothetical protein
MDFKPDEFQTVAHAQLFHAVQVKKHLLQQNYVNQLKSFSNWLWNLSKGLKIAHVCPKSAPTKRYKNMQLKSNIQIE